MVKWIRPWAKFKCTQVQIPPLQGFHQSYNRSEKTENNAFFFIDQSINQSINYILGVFQINDSEIIIEPYKHHPQFTLEKGTNDNHILYSSKIMPTELDFRSFSSSKRSKPIKPFDPGRKVAPIKLVIQNSMIKRIYKSSNLISIIQPSSFNHTIFLSII